MPPTHPPTHIHTHTKTHTQNTHKHTHTNKAAIALSSHLNGLRFSGVDVGDAIILLFMEGNFIHIVKHTQQVCLDGVRVGGLSQDFKEGGVGHKEEPWEDKSLLLQIASEGLLT